MSKKIIGDVNLSNWHLEQLPEILKDVSIDGHFYCYQNPVKFTEKQVRSVSDVKGMVGV
jgi:hypothetical protein